MYIYIYILMEGHHETSGMNSARWLSWDFSLDVDICQVPPTAGTVSNGFGNGV